jgi:hypothetical protein
LFRIAINYNSHVTLLSVRLMAVKSPEPLL